VGRKGLRKWDRLFDSEHSTAHAVSGLRAEAKYKAKAAIDSFFWRVGDVFGSVLVFAGTHFLLGSQLPYQHSFGVV
jgi:ATP/ADP translocase